MQAEVALYVLAHRHRDVHIICNRCDAAYREPSEYLVERFGPLFPVGRICQGIRCRKCSSRDLGVHVY